ncbi:MAG: hypothetical protein C5B45_04820 [Chlamydiae bacterium]|nr:MAG: hypothetical protein C5B45_04820 [Chlamydiota bacterium]
MPHINSTLTCQVDGLNKVYTYGKSIYFSFEDEEQLKKAKEKVIQLWARTDHSTPKSNLQKKTVGQKESLELLVSYPREAPFCFGISTKSATESTEKLIVRVTNIINLGTSDRTVPIKEIKKPEELRYRTSF